MLGPPHRARDHCQAGSADRLPSDNRSARSRCWVVAGALVLVLGAGGCGRHGKSSPVGGDDRPPSKVNLKRNVELAQASQRSLVYYVETVGVLEAEAQTDIAAGVTGIVDEVLFREGDEVDPGRVLVKVDQRRYTSELKVAEANLARAEKNLALAKVLARNAQMAGPGVSVEEKDKTALNLSIAEADLQSARASLELKKNYYERSQVRSPYAGWINQRRITPGTYVEEKTVVATIADLSRIRLVGWVPENAAPTIKQLYSHQEARLKVNRLALPLGCWLNGAGPWTGLAAQVIVASQQVPSGFDPEFTLMALPRQSFVGRIFYLSTVANPDTHMFECKAEVETRGLGDLLRPGYTARIRFPLRGNPTACVVPEESVRASERGFIAFEPVQRAGRDGKTEWVAKARPVEVGYRTPGWVEVGHGLVPGQWIVRRGAEALEDGTPLRIPDAQLEQLTGTP